MGANIDIRGEQPGAIGDRLTQVYDLTWYIGCISDTKQIFWGRESECLHALENSFVQTRTGSRRFIICDCLFSNIQDRFDRSSEIRLFFKTCFPFIKSKMLDLTALFVKTGIKTFGFKVTLPCSSCWLCVRFAGCCWIKQHPANRTHNPQLHTRPTTWKPQHEIPQVATTV